METPLPRHHLDARALIGIAHPLRVRLRDRLRRGGPATATQLAREFGESSGATSYHLRMLARHGMVEEDPNYGKGRERWWRATPGAFQIDLSELLDDDVARGALRVVSSELNRIAEQRLLTWLEERQRWSGAWRDASENTAYVARLDPASLLELRDRLTALIDEYVARPPTPGTRNVEIELNMFPTGEPE